ncbi:MAG: aminoacetone oxidase family FAD-binding enzyme [Elusimicrobia bacterium CG_4_10_14_0_8_um_filter_37_32]|nr:MAG: aminoacetone oxidase family FAD-binding enzyme [Elusimicrobia bacterium CG_4_10_14_0_8_um_filter_37_32]
MERIFDVVVIGGGASGMFASGGAAEKGDNVLLVERGERLGRKLSITGKGRCNITNAGEIKDFIKSYGNNGKFLYRAFTEFFNQDLTTFFNQYGVRTKQERGGRIFPVSDNSQSIVNALKNYLGENKVMIKLNSRAEEIIISENKPSEKDFRKHKVDGIKLKNSAEIIKSVKVILATGGISYPGTGSTGDGYFIAEKVGHSIVPLRPALVPLETKDIFVKSLQGLTLKNVMVTVFDNDKKIDSEFGDMLFTHFGVSGPIILKLSGLIVDNLSRNKRVTISINLKPALDKDKLDARLLREFKNSGIRSICNVIKNLLPRKLIPVFMKLTGIVSDKKCCQITQSEREKIISLLTNFNLEISKPRPVEEAIITRGGVALDEINPYTMESKKVKGLYFCGEIIDIDGITGGYNLQAAFSTAYLAANN